MMTFNDVFEQLGTIDRISVSLLKAARFHSDEGLSDAVRPLKDPAEDIFVRGFTENLLESLELLHEELAYLNSPVFFRVPVRAFP